MDLRPYVQLRRPRSWTETLSATVDIVRWNFASLFLYVAKHVLPWILLSGVLLAITLVYGLSGVLTGDIEAMIELAKGLEGEVVVIAVVVGVIGYISTVLVSLWQSSIVVSWLSAYDQAGSTPTEERLIYARQYVAPRVFSTLVTIAGIGIGALFVVAAIYVILFVGLDFFAAISIAALVSFPLVILVVYVGVVVSLASPISAFEDVVGLEAVKQSFLMIRGYWWWLMGYLLVISLVVGVAGYVFQVPDLVVSILSSVMGGGAESSALSIMRAVTLTISNVGTQMLGTITLLAIGVAYHSIRENRFGSHLESMAGTFYQSDNAVQPNSPNQVDSTDQVDDTEQTK